MAETSWVNNFDACVYWGRVLEHEGPSGIEGVNYNQYNSYHHLQGLLMASPQAGKESNTHLHLGNRHASAYAPCLLSIIAVRVALS